jgi:hypothetical protein
MGRKRSLIQVNGRLCCQAYLISRARPSGKTLPDTPPPDQKPTLRQQLRANPRTLSCSEFFFVAGPQEKAPPTKRGKVLTRGRKAERGRSPGPWHCLLLVGARASSPTPSRRAGDSRQLECSSERPTRSRARFVREHFLGGCIANATLVGQQRTLDSRD